MCIFVGRCVYVCVRVRACAREPIRLYAHTHLQNPASHIYISEQSQPHTTDTSSAKRALIRCKRALIFQLCEGWVLRVRVTHVTRQTLWTYDYWHTYSSEQTQHIYIYTQIPRDIRSQPPYRRTTCDLIMYVTWLIQKWWQKSTAIPPMRTHTYRHMYGCMYTYTCIYAIHKNIMIYIFTLSLTHTHMHIFWRKNGFNGPGWRWTHTDAHRDTHG